MQRSPFLVFCRGVYVLNCYSSTGLKNCLLVYTFKKSFYLHAFISISEIIMTLTRRGSKRKYGQRYFLFLIIINTAGTCLCPWCSTSLTWTPIQPILCRCSVICTSPLLLSTPFLWLLCCALCALPCLGPVALSSLLQPASHTALAPAHALPVIGTSNQPHLHIGYIVVFDLWLYDNIFL